MSMIDLDNQEPFFLTIKTRGYAITQLVRPTAGKVEIVSSSTNCINYNGVKLASFTTETSITTDLSFEAIKGSRNKNLLTMKKV